MDEFSLQYKKWNCCEIAANGVFRVVLSIARHLVQRPEQSSGPFQALTDEKCEEWGYP